MCFLTRPAPRGARLEVGTHPNATADDDPGAMRFRHGAERGPPRSRGAGRLSNAGVRNGWRRLTEQPHREVAGSKRVDPGSHASRRAPAELRLGAEARSIGRVASPSAPPPSRSAPAASRVVARARRSAAEARSAAREARRRRRTLPLPHARPRDPHRKPPRPRRKADSPRRKLRDRRRPARQRRRR